MTNPEARAPDEMYRWQVVVEGTERMMIPQGWLYRTIVSHTTSQIYDAIIDRTLVKTSNHPPAVAMVFVPARHEAT